MSQVICLYLMHADIGSKGNQKENLAISADKLSSRKNFFKILHKKIVLKDE